MGQYFRPDHQIYKGKSAPKKKLLSRHPLFVSLLFEEALLKILAWEIGLHEMFWDAIDGMVVHRTFGRGTITAKHVQRIGRKGYITRLISIKFDCGQSCTFHARVDRDERVSDSLGRDVERILGHRLID